MTQTQEHIDFCAHLNTITNRDSYLVCEDCGLVLPQGPEHKYYIPYKNNAYERNNTQLQNSPLNSNTIGNHKERKNNSKIARLDKLQNQRSNKEIKEFKNLLEVKRLSSSLKLPNYLQAKILKNTNKYQEQLRKGTKYQANLIIPTTLYLTCLENHIFINIPELLEYSEVYKTDFNEALYLIYKNNLNLYKITKTPKFRKHNILVQLSGINSEFCLPEGYIKLSKNILFSCWDDFKHLKNNIVAGLVYSIATSILARSNKNIEWKGKAVNHICNFLGIMRSTISKNIDRILAKFILQSLAKKKYTWDKETIQFLYWERDPPMSTLEIAKEFNTCAAVITKFMRDNNIPIRSYSAAAILKCKNPLKNNKTKFELDSNLLRELYLEKKLTIPQIAKRLNCSYSTIRNKLIKYGIPIRHTGTYERKKKKTSKNLFGEVMLQQ